MRYDPDPHFDEAFSAPDEVREPYRQVLEALEGCDLRKLSEKVSQDAADRGMTFGDDEEPFHLDPVPRIIDADEWELLERGLVQRARTLNAFLADVYGERKMVRAGRIPERVVDSAAPLEPELASLPAPEFPAGVTGFDIVRDDTGELLVLEDNVRTPSGGAYAAEAREILDARLPVKAPRARRPLGLAECLAATLRGAAPAGCDEPAPVLLSDGPGSSAFWEHRILARELAIAIVSPDDLEVRSGRLWARGNGGSRRRPVDVVYRRTDESQLRDRAGRLTWLGELFLEPLRNGTVGCVNGFGTGVADDKLVHAYVDEMTRFYLDEDPLIRSVTTYDPGEPEVRASILDRIDELVIKPRTGHGGRGVIVCPHASPADRERAAELVRTRPEECVAQETINLSTHPTVVDGALAPRHVDLRAFVFCAPAGARAMPGGLTRVALDSGALVVNSSMNGGGKDTWMLGRS